MKKKNPKKSGSSLQSHIILFCKGLMMGFSSFLCSLSLTSLAPSFHLYDDIIDCFSHPKENVSKHLFFLLIFGLSILVSFAISQFFLLDFLAVYPVLLLMFMIGILAGSLFHSFTEIRTGVKCVSNWICFLIFFLASLFFSIPILSIPTSTISLDTILTSFGGGGLASVAVMIPCTSIMFPSFWSVLSNVSSVCHLLIYLVGFFVGMVLISKMMEYLLQNHKMKVSFAFFGFFVAMLVAILWTLCFVQLSWIQFLIGDVLALIGYFIVIQLGRC